MLSAASRPTLAKNARMGHPRFVMGKKQQSVVEAGPPAKSHPTIFMCSAPFLRALVCLSSPSLLGGLEPTRLSNQPGTQMVCDEKGRASDCRSGNVRGIPRLENRDTWGTRVKRSRTVSAVRQATSRKAREVAHPH